MRNLIFAGVACVAVLTSVAYADGGGTSGEDTPVDVLPFQQPVFHFIAADGSATAFVINDFTIPALSLEPIFNCKDDKGAALAIKIDSIQWVQTDRVIPVGPTADGASIVVASDNKAIVVRAVVEGSSDQSFKFDVSPEYACGIQGQTSLAAFQQEYQNNLREIARRHNLLIGEIRSDLPGASATLSQILVARENIQRLERGFKLDMGFDPHATDGAIFPASMVNDLAPLVPEEATYNLVAQIGGQLGNMGQYLIDHYEWNNLVAEYRIAMEYNESDAKYIEAKQAFLKIRDRYSYSASALQLVTDPNITLAYIKMCNDLNINSGS